MTRYYEFSESLPMAKRKLNESFVHELKKMCARAHLHVHEVLNHANGDDEELGDYVYVPMPTEEKFDRTAIEKMCLRYGIGDSHIQVLDSIERDDEVYFQVFLEKPAPYNG